MATIVKFETNIPMKVKFAPKPGDWFGEPQPGTYNGKPTMQFKYKIATSDVPEGLTYATQLLHDIIQVSGVQAGEVVTITRRDRDWEVETGIGNYTKASLTQVPSEPEKGLVLPVPGGVAGSAVAPPPLATKAQYVPPESMAQEAVNQQGLGIYAPPPNLTFNEVACLVWKSARAVQRILETSGLEFGSTEVSSLGAQIAIRCEREKVRPTPEDMAKFAAEMGGRKGDVIGDGGYLAIKAIATKIGVPECDLVARMGGIYMKALKTDKYPVNPREFPVALVPEVETYLDAMQKVGPLA